MNLGLIINPTAGGGSALAAGEQAQKVFEQAGLEVLDLSGSSLIEAKANAQAAILKNQIDCLVVVGGDGIMHLGVNLCAGTNLPLGLIASGTGNDAARTLGLPVGDAVAAANLIVAKLANPRNIDVVKAHTTAGSFWFIGSISAGFDALVARRANRMKWPKGPAKYTIAMLLELASFKSIHFDAVIDGHPRSFDAMLCAACNTKGFGGGLLVAPDAQVDDSLIDLFIVHKISRLELIKVYPKAYTGAHIGHPAVEIVRASKVKLSSGDMPAFADGEAVGNSPIEAEVVPGALRMFCN